MNEFTKLLNKYFNARQELNIALLGYINIRNKCRRYLNAENQKEVDLLKFAQENNLRLDEVVEEWNENKIPITLMRLKEVRKINEFKCKESKKKVKECQIKFNQVCQEINNYLLYDKCKRNSRRQFKYFFNKMGIRFNH